MNLPRCLVLVLVFLFAGSLFAETPEERAKKVTVTMNLTDVPPGAAAHFVEVVSNVKIHYQGYPADQTLLSVNFENTSADEALRYIANLAKLDLAYKADGAHFTPKK
jgi:hypothetical protein